MPAHELTAKLDVADLESSGISMKPSWQRAQREQRYSRAEEALARSLRRCSYESSEHDLQIRALERATALLATRAREAHERAAELRKRLSEADLDNADYAELKKQRWLEEHREAVAQQEEKEAIQRLQSMTQTRGATVPQGYTDVSTSSAPARTRREENLALFLRSSPTLRPLHNHSPSHSFAMSSQFDISHRRQTLSDVSTLQLQASLDTSAALRRSMAREGHNRTKSLPNGDEIRGKSSQAESLGTPGRRPRLSIKRLPNNKPLSAVFEDDDREQHSAKSPMLSPPWSQYKPIPPVPRHLTRRLRKESSGSGNVRILPRAVARPAEDIVASVNRKGVALPSYAIGLMDEFAQDLSLSLDLTTPSLTTSSASPVSSDSLPTVSPANSVRGAPDRWKLRRSLFSVHIPSRRSIDPVAPLPVTSPGSEEDDHAPDPIRRRAKVLPSTRNWDLMQIGVAPDDVHDISRSTDLHDAKSTRTAASKRVVDKVRQGFMMFGRKS
ncbi:hypothetical protein BD410DRAFT_784662 [Rickenella mellea]|uniref:Uncharacterized protein n=1 Tax=Rickenella mellea TaxID=50990 RepID=A0A4Y7QD60_9AGAM|nr:hypothetical protein BD410DRAFT_784662 [Rickenella mellea]